MRDIDGGLGAAVSFFATLQGLTRLREPPFSPLAGEMSPEATEGGGATNPTSNMLNHPHLSALLTSSPQGGRKELAAPSAISLPIPI